MGNNPIKQILCNSIISPPYYTTSVSSNYTWSGGLNGSSGILGINMGSFTTYPMKKISPEFNKDYFLEILSHVKGWAEGFCVKSSYFDASLKGFSGLASRRILKELKDRDCQAKLAYTRKNGLMHIFCLLKESGDSTEEYLADVTANIFGEESIVFVKKSEVDLAAKPWWDYTHTYTSEASLLKKQRKDGWPEHQVTLHEAKKQIVPGYKFVTDGKTDIEQGKIKILPFDDEAITFLKSKAKVKDFGTNVAQLLLNCPSKDLPNLIKMVKNYL